MHPVRSNPCFSMREKSWRTNFCKIKKVIRSESIFIIVAYNLFVLNVKYETYHDENYKKCEIKRGEFDNISIMNAKTAKIHALKIIRTLKTTSSGRSFLNQIYSEIKSVILNKYYMNKSNGELIKTELPNINHEMQTIVEKYQDKPCVDLQFLMGLIYIATSNCAMQWKYGEDVVDEINN